MELEGSHLECPKTGFMATGGVRGCENQGGAVGFDQISRGGFSELTQQDC